MAADAINIILDVSTPRGQLYQSLSNLNLFSLEAVYQDALLKLHIYPVVPTGNIISGPFFTKLDLSTLDLQVAVGRDTGAENILAAQYLWDKQTAADPNGESGYFHATLDFDTEAMAEELGERSDFTTKFQFLLNRNSTGFRTVHQADISVKAVVKGPGSAASIPTPTVNYMTREECFAAFVMWNNALRTGNAGRNVIFVSPNGSRTRELGIADDGSTIDNQT